MSLCILPSENKWSSLDAEQTIDKRREDTLDHTGHSPIRSKSKNSLTGKRPERPAVSSTITTRQHKRRKHADGDGASVPSWNEKMEPGSFRRLQGRLPDGHDARWQAGSGGSSHCQGKGREHHLSPTSVNLHLRQVMGVGILAGEDVSEHLGGKKLPSVLNTKHIITGAIKKRKQV